MDNFGCICFSSLPSPQAQLLPSTRGTCHDATGSIPPECMLGTLLKASVVTCKRGLLTTAVVQ